MSTIREFMSKDHRHCDELLASAEAAVSQKNWDKGNELTQLFLDATEHHLAAEEQVLFPAFEERTGMTAGPTMMMRQEHEQMRNLFQQMRSALESQEQADYLDSTETLLVLIQQHNMKEEGILYPMCDEHLGADADRLVSAMEQVAA